MDVSPDTVKASGSPPWSPKAIMQTHCAHHVDLTDKAITTAAARLLP